MSIIGKTVKFHVSASDVQCAVVLDKYRANGVSGDVYLVQKFESGEIGSISPLDITAIEDTPQVAAPYPKG
jgi:hypothetical protein